ncbi:MAG: hypothetical protein FWH26_02900 [Oscillospiraceae bacterium]|nr:hypothetical protein [Oscillospiraceae bacterium]
MSALDKIVEEITAQAQARADEILAEAERQAGEIRARSQAQCEAFQRQFERDSEPELRESAARRQGADRQARRLALLQTRSELLDEIMAEAKAALARQAGPERFQTLWQGDVLLNNSLDAIFEAEEQTLRDRAYAALTGGKA